MASPKQIQANRRNAQRSTGPRTDEGKSVSSRNALKFGIHAKDETVTGPLDLPELVRLKEEYYQHHNPAVPERRTLIDSLVRDEYLLCRFRVIEARLMTHYCNSYSGEGSPVGFAYMQCSARLERLQHRINATGKHFGEALRQLHRLEDAAQAGSAPALSCK